MMAKKAICQFQNQISQLKRMCFDDQSFITRLWSITQRRNSIINSYLALLKIKHFIIGRITMKTVAANNYRNRSLVSWQYSAANVVLNIRTLYFIMNKQKPNHSCPVSTNVLTFQLQEALLENFFLKHAKKLLSVAKKAISKEDLEKQWGGPEAYKLILFIKDDFYEIVNKHPSILVFFSAEWCHHCLKLRAQYGAAALMAKEANLSVTFATFDVNSDPNIADENGIIGIPAVKYYKDGKIASTFKGKRTANDLFAYVKNPPGPTKNKVADV